MYNQMYETTFTHIYFTRGFGVGSSKAPRRHGCLKSGYWCLENALEHPGDIITFLKLIILEVINSVTNK